MEAILSVLQFSVSALGQGLIFSLKGEVKAASIARVSPALPSGAHVNTPLAVVIM